jgi:hypothetical protein
METLTIFVLLAVLIVLSPILIGIGRTLIYALFMWMVSR